MKKLFTSTLMMFIALATWAQQPQQLSEHIKVTWTSPTLTLEVSEGVKKEEEINLLKQQEWYGQVENLVLQGTFTNKELGEMNDVLQGCGSAMNVDMSACSGLYCKYLDYAEVGGESGEEYDQINTTFYVEYPDMHEDPNPKNVEKRRLFYYKGKLINSSDVVEDENGRYTYNTGKYVDSEGNVYNGTPQGNAQTGYYYTGLYDYDKNCEYVGSQNNAYEGLIKESSTGKWFYFDDTYVILNQDEAPQVNVNNIVSQIKQGQGPGGNGSGWDSEDPTIYNYYDYYYDPNQWPNGPVPLKIKFTKHYIEENHRFDLTEQIVYLIPSDVWVYEEPKPAHEGGGVKYIVVPEDDVDNKVDSDTSTEDIYELGSTGTYTKMIGGEKFVLGNFKSSIKTIILPDNENFTFVPAIDVLTSSNCLESVTLSDKIRALDIAAFLNCTNLTTINFPASLEQIGGDCFNGCKALTNGDLSATQLDRVRYHTFNDCEAITEFFFPEETLRYIQTQAFQRCKGFTDLNLQNCHELELIGSKAFGECTSLVNVNVCSHPKVIKGGTGDGAFYNSKAIQQVKITYCTGTKVDKCICEFNAFDYDVTNSQTQVQNVDKCARLIFEHGDNVNEPFIDDFDFFQGYYKTGVYLRQSNLLKYWRNVCSDSRNGQSGKAPDNYNAEASGVPANQLGRYVDNGWIEFINTGDFIPVVPNNDGHFLRTYSRNLGSGPMRLTLEDENGKTVGMHAYRATGYAVTKESTELKDSEGNWLVLGGYIVLKEITTTINGKTIGYVPEGTGVVLHSQDFTEAGGFIAAKDFENGNTLTKYPNTGKVLLEDNPNVNMLIGSEGYELQIAPTDPWIWGNYGPSGQGGYGATRTFRNFGLRGPDCSTALWVRTKPGNLRENRAYAHIPVGLFNNENEAAETNTLEYTINGLHSEDDEGGTQHIGLGLIFEGDEATGIHSHTIEPNGTIAEDDAWYTPQGVRVNVPTKGIYIHNNKKVIIQ
jgi:hypothetical protein